MAKMGRPTVELDWDLLRKICSFPVAQKDIAWIMDVSIDTLANRIRKKFKCTFSEYLDKNKALYRLKLHQKQYEVAMKGHATMLIWLGKQHLGQSDVSVQYEGDISQANNIAPLIIDTSGVHVPKEELEE